MSVTRPLLLALAATLACAAPAAAQSNPLQESPGVPPPGANDFSCRSTAHPVPVILVHGTFGDMTVSWNELGPQLKAEGYCVFALDYGRRGTQPIDGSADQLAAFARDVLARTGAAKVSFVGHSQGGMLSRYVAKSRGLLEQTDDVIGLAPSSHGTTNPGADFAATFFGCPACAEQKAGSPFMQKVNTPPEAPEPAQYTVISTRYDEVVTPVASQFLSGPTVTNVLLQDKCPNDISEHVNIIYDPIALQWVRNALGRPGPADPAFVPDCTGGATSTRAGAAPGSGSGTQGSGTATTRPGSSTSRVATADGRLRIVPRTVRLRRRDGTVAVRIRCDAEATCRGLLDLSRDNRAVGRRSFAITSVTERWVRVRVDRAARRLIRRKGRLRLGVVATLAQQGGAAQRATTRIVVLR